MDNLTEQLNLPQREAVVHGPGPALILAGPGSGKTFTVVKRIQYLIDEMHVPPEEILVITFTKDAALSMQERFLQQSDKAQPVNFGTFHSVFYHIIRQSAHSRSNNSSGSGILTEARKRQLITPILKEIRQRTDKNSYTPDNMSSDAGEILAAIGFYKNTGEETGAVRRLSQEWRPYFGEIMAAYQEKTAREHAMDFDDMVFECRRILEQDEELRAFWQGRFSHILIDEFQDINPMQYQVIKLLTRPPYNLFAVGDDDQAIYGFRGSSPACLRQFAEEFHADRVILNQNYRSRAEIVDAAQKVIAENRERFSKKLCAAAEEKTLTDKKTPIQTLMQEKAFLEEPVKILHFEEREQQNAYLRDRIGNFLKDNPGMSCAVLFRTNTFMQSFRAGLAREGIAYAMREKAKNIYEHFIVRDVMAYLQFAAGDRRRSVFLQFMNKPARFLRRDALADMEIVDFQRMKQWYRSGDSKHRLDCLDTIDRLQAQIEAMRNMPPWLAVRYVCRAVGYEGWLRGQAGGETGDKWEEWSEILDWLKADAKGYEDAAAWTEAQKKFRGEAEGHGRGNKAESPTGQNAVQLMTVHAAKGLEFDKVWMPDCNEKNYPHGSMPDREAVEEERRIFYVGMTRAKKSLELCCLTGTRERPRLMSRFLNPIADDHSSKSSSNSQLSRYSSKASSTFSYSSSSSM